MCGRSRVVSIAGVEPDVGARVCSSITISSSDALPARSPMPVDRALDLARARQHAGERVRDRQAEVVVAVDRERRRRAAPGTSS